MAYRAAEIAEYLALRESFDLDAADRAGAAIAALWNDHDFRLEVTTQTLSARAASSSAAAPPDAVLARLARRFAVHLQSAPAARPQPTPPAPVDRVCRRCDRTYRCDRTPMSEDGWCMLCRPTVEVSCDRCAAPCQGAYDGQRKCTGCRASRLGTQQYEDKQAALLMRDTAPPGAPHRLPPTDSPAAVSSSPSPIDTRPAGASTTSLDLIPEFAGAHDFLSTSSAHPVTWQGITYPTAVAAFQAGKTLDEGQRARIAAAATPDQAVMHEVLAAKFTNTHLAERLVATGTALLIDGNATCSQFWGCCSCTSHRTTPGLNWLGRDLMRLRALLRPASQRARWTRVACTGHRPHLLPAGCHDWLATELRRVADKLVDQHGMEIAISGAAAGADLLWAEAGSAAGARLWLYQPYPDHDTRWDQAWRDRLTTARARASRVATLGEGYSVAVLHRRSDWVLRDCDALVAVVDPRRRSGGTVTALSRVQPGTPIIHVDVHNLRTTVRRPVSA